MTDWTGWQFPAWESALHEYSKVRSECAELKESLRLAEITRDSMLSQAFLKAKRDGMTVEEAKHTARLDKEYIAAAEDVARLEGKLDYVWGRIKAAELWFEMTRSAVSYRKAEMEMQ